MEEVTSALNLRAYSITVRLIHTSSVLCALLLQLKADPKKDINGQGILIMGECDIISPRLQRLAYSKLKFSIICYRVFYCPPSS